MVLFILLIALLILVGLSVTERGLLISPAVIVNLLISSFISELLLYVFSSSVCGCIHTKVFCLSDELTHSSLTPVILPVLKITLSDIRTIGS